MGPASKPVLVWLAAVWLVELESMALSGSSDGLLKNYDGGDV